MAEKDCGCQIKVYYRGYQEGSGEFAYCPLHEAAPDMLWLLENIVKAPREKGSSWRVLIQIKDEAQDLIRKAKGEGENTCPSN